MMSGRRVLWVSTGLSTRGGVASCVRTLTDTPLRDTWSIEHIATHCDGSVLTRMLAFARGVGAFVAALATRRPDLVHLHMSSYGSFVRKATLAALARVVRLPVVLHVHGSEFGLFYQRAPRLLRLLIRATLTRADAVVALGERWADRLRQIAPAATIVVIPNAVRVLPPVRQPGHGERVHVVFVGAIGDRKGTFTLVDAWARLADRAWPARLTIAGDGEVTRARKTIEQLGLTASAEVVGWLSAADTAALLDSAHVLVLPSQHEGQPMAVLEAMARGLSIVASTAGGIPDLVEDGSSALLVPDGDLDALTAALRRVVTDHHTRARLATAAHQRAGQHFDVEIVWQRFDALYKEVLG